MAQLIVLGSGHAVPDLDHENTHFLLLLEGQGILIDCASNPILQLSRVGVELDRITDLILTHFHPDHVSGVPLLFMSMWLLGRKKPLHVYGLKYTIDRVEMMMNLYEWQNWPDFFPVIFHHIAENELSPVLSNENIRILASPVCHLIPTIGLRMEFPLLGKVVAYSCDTEPCQAVVRLAKEADILFHEATAASKGHSSAIQAVDIASQSQARTLYLIHYSARGSDLSEILVKAQHNFSGPVHMAQDYLSLEI
jgi:ribonuclease Z